MTPVAGIALVLAGLLASIVGTHLKARRYFDRPSLARNRLFDPLLAFLKWVLIVSGLVLVSRVSLRAAAAVTGLLAALWGYRRIIRGVRFQGWLLRRDYEALKRLKPGLPEREILCELAYRRNPRWGEELIEQMVIDYPTIDDLARMIARMERGFRGFR